MPIKKVNTVLMYRPPAVGKSGSFMANVAVTGHEMLNDSSLEALNCAMVAILKICQKNKLNFKGEISKPQPWVDVEKINFGDTTKQEKKPMRKCAMGESSLSVEDVDKIFNRKLAEIKNGSEPATVGLIISESQFKQVETVISENEKRWGWNNRKRYDYIELWYMRIEHTPTAHKTDYFKCQTIN